MTLSVLLGPATVTSPFDDAGGPGPAGRSLLTRSSQDRGQVFFDAVQPGPRPCLC